MKVKHQLQNLLRESMELMPYMDLHAPPNNDIKRWEKPVQEEYSPTNTISYENRLNR